ncbi:hypothetical protein FXO38_22031 [Capsicum annuum]|nr:hypothetical protein FXO38_22031 [Capsicum annuum]
MSGRSILFCVFLLLGVCMGIITATARELKRENNKLFGTSSTLSWWHHRHPPRWWWHHHRPYYVPSIGWWLRHKHHPIKPSPPTHVAPFPIDNGIPPLHMTSPTHPPQVAPSHDAVISSPHTTLPPTQPPHAAPPTSCSMLPIKVNGCVPDLITSFIKGKVSSSTQCCKVVSSTSDECFDKGLTLFRIPSFRRKMRNYCTHHQW